MTSTYLCDYCRAAIDPRVGDPLIVVAHRGVDPDDWGSSAADLITGQNQTFRYCSQQHAGLHLERVPLPSVGTDNDVSGIAVLAGFVIAVAVLALTVYGGIQFWQEIAGGWF